MRPNTEVARQVVPDALERCIRANLAEWRELLTCNVQSGREVLKALLVDSPRFTPEAGHGRRYRFTGAIALDRLLAGVVDSPMRGVPSGILLSSAALQLECTASAI